MASLYRHTECDWEEFKAIMGRCLAKKKKKPGDIILIGADCNASMGSNHHAEAEWNKTCGKFEKNRRVPGKWLFSILAQRSLALPFTFFRTRGWRSYTTWSSIEATMSCIRLTTSSATSGI